LFILAPSIISPSLPRHINYKMECYNLVASDMHTLQSPADHLLYILPCNDQLPIRQADIITLAHTHTIYLCSAHSGSDFCCLDVFRSLSHGFAIRLEVGLEVKSKQCSNTLGHSFSWNNVDGFA